MILIDFIFHVVKAKNPVRFWDLKIIRLSRLLIHVAFLLFSLSQNLLDDKLFRLEQNNGADKHLELASSTANPKE